MFNKKNHQLSIVIPILNESKNINLLNLFKEKVKQKETYLSLVCQVLKKQNMKIFL